MKTIYFKIALIISFSLIIIPGKSVSFFNFLILLLNFLEVFYIDFSKIDFGAVCYSVFVVLVNMSVVMMFSKNRIVSVMSLFIQFYWLFYLFETTFLKDWYFTIPISIYLILSLTLLYFLFFKKED
jgi:hypothetical protein